MNKKFKPRLTYANVMSSIAVFVALGGTAFAASHLVTTNDIANRAVTAQKISPGAVTAQKIRNQSVRPIKIVRNGIFPAHIRPNAVRPSRIAPGAVIASRIADSAVESEKLAPESVSTSKIAPEAVDSSRLATSSVTSSKLATSSVDSSKLDTSSVSEVFQPRGDLLYASVNGSGELQPGNSRGATGATQTGTGAYAVTFERPVDGCAWFPSRSAIGTGIPANGDFLGVGGQTGQPNNVRVRIRNNNNVLANRSFSLLVVC